MNEYTEREYALFIMAYDFPIIFEGLTSDSAFDRACDLWHEFVGSEYDDADEGLYTCIENFIRDKGCEV